MPRSPREDFEGAWHHAMNRGAGRRDIYCDAEDRAFFLDCIGTAASTSATDVHAYCLMSNHFHLLVHSREGRMSEFLRLTAGRYARYFNKRWNSDGPIFRARGRTIEVKDDAHLMLASRYIHLNPVVAGLLATATNWRWSSAGAYLGAAARPEWLRTDFILAMCEENRVNYADYMAEGLDEKTAAFYKDIDH